MVTLYRHGDCQFFDKVVCHKMIPVLLEGRFFYQICSMPSFPLKHINEFISNCKVKLQKYMRGSKCFRGGGGPNRIICRRKGEDPILIAFFKSALGNKKS